MIQSSSSTSEHCNQSFPLNFSDVYEENRLEVCSILSHRVPFKIINNKLGPLVRLYIHFAMDAYWLFLPENDQ